MVLSELAQGLRRAVERATTSSTVDARVVTQLTNDMAHALLKSDVDMKVVCTLLDNVKKRVNLEGLAAGHDKHKIVQQAVFDGLCDMLEQASVPKVKKGSVVMFVGLQGAGKTRTCTKFAYYHKRGFRPAVVCADTFRAGAADQLMQDATEAGIPFYANQRERDAATVAREGVELFKKEKRDLILVDTSGRHKQEAALLEEMRGIAEATRPDLVILVMDGSIGQSAYDQAKAFKDGFEVGAVIITKMDGHAKGGGTLSAVCATKSPVLFLGTGEHKEDLEEFSSRSFVARLLGKPDLVSVAKRVKEVMSDDAELQEMQDMLITNRRLTLRMFYMMCKNSSEGSLNQIMASMAPGIESHLNKATVKRSLVIMESMTKQELEDPKLLPNPSRVMRIARGSGSTVADVLELLARYNKVAKQMQNFKVPKSLMNMNQNALKNMDPSMILKKMRLSFKL